MSRSYRKPYYTDQQRSSQSVKSKRDANKTVRRANKMAIIDDVETLASGKSYRKAFNSYNIRDYSFHDKDPKARRK